MRDRWQAGVCSALEGNHEWRPPTLSDLRGDEKGSQSLARAGEISPASFDFSGRLRNLTRFIARSCFAIHPDQASERGDNPRMSCDWKCSFERAVRMSLGARERAINREGSKQ